MNTLQLTFGRRSIQERFEDFHYRHPDVYRRLLSLSLEAKASGREQWAIGNLWEVLRWEMHIVGLPDASEEFKLNDHYRSRYARLLMETEPSLDGFFNTRKLTS